MQAFSACFMKFCLALNSYKSKKKQMGRRPEGTCSFLVNHEQMQAAGGRQPGYEQTGGLL